MHTVKVTPFPSVSRYCFPRVEFTIRDIFKGKTLGVNSETKKTSLFKACKHMEPVKGMVAAERTTNEFERHLGCLGKEGTEARVVTKAEWARDQSDGWERPLGRWSFLFQNVQS